MRCILVLLLLAVASLEALPRPGENEDRIADGVDSPPGAFPFLPAVRILVNFQNVPAFGGCSSTVISKRHILTAGHCIALSTKVSDNVYNVKYNLAFFMNFGEYVPNFVFKTSVTIFEEKFGFASRAIIHPSFYRGIFGHDIAVIEFPEGTDFGIEPIALAKDYVAKDNDEAFAAGYGLINVEYVTNENGIEVEKYTDTERLRNTTVSIYTEETCKKKHAINALAYQASHDLICMGKETKTILFGDSGGPLMIERRGKLYQVGISSFIYLNPDSPNAFFTPISSHCDFISKATKGEVKCESLFKEPQPPSKPEDSGGPKPGQSEGLVSSAVTMNLSAVLTILMVLLQFF